MSDRSEKVIVPNNPLVTSVIRTYKRPNLVGRAIVSVLNQSFQDFELIVIDDCSPDNTSEIVRHYADKDHRIRYIRHEVNKGHIVSLNIANHAARGKYIAYLDDDDVWLPNKLELQVAKMEEMGEECGLVTGGTRHVDMDTGETLRVLIPQHSGYVYWDALELGSVVFGPPSVVMLRSSAIDKLGDFDENMPRGAGQDYFRRLAKQFKVAYVDDICLDYYMNKESISTHDSLQDWHNEIKARKIKLAHLDDDLKRLPRAYARELRLLGESYFMVGEMGQGRSCLFKAIRAWGLNRELVLKWILSLFGKSAYIYFFSPGFRFAPKYVPKYMVMRILHR